MHRLIRQVSITFSAGCFGALINSWVLWYLGSHGITHHFGVSIAPLWAKSFIYPRLVWGGLWGLLFLLPLWRSGFWIGVFSRGILLSFVPSLFQLLYVFPLVAHKGWLGLQLGSLTPLLVILVNVVWGLSTAMWIYAAKS